MCSMAELVQCQNQCLLSPTRVAMMELNAVWRRSGGRYV
jgi:hypothetical protein